MRSDEFTVRQWPDWSFWNSRQRARPLNRSRVIAVTSTGAALLVQVVLTAQLGNPTYAVLTVLYAAVCLLALWHGPLAPRRQRILLVVAMFALGTAPAAILDKPEYLTDLTYAIAIGIMLLPLRYSVPLGLITAATQVTWMQVAQGKVLWGAVATLLGVTAVLGMVVALSFTIGQLRAAREQVRGLAVSEERERVARDLHDVLGHSLSTITVKLGLTRRILETTKDVEAAQQEIRELEALSRQALSDVRATVSDYRTVSLAVELSGARLALRAAGVRADLPSATDDVQPELQAVFGYVVREAVTNVLRHSTAANCVVRLGPDWVEITDDGAVTDAPEPGTGLTGLAERLAAVSGTLEHTVIPTGGFQVRAIGPQA
ncbi:sensor histidine kinase [Kribbella sp. NPDC055071]